MTRQTIGVAIRGGNFRSMVVYLTDGYSRRNRLNAQHCLFSRYVSFRYRPTGGHDLARRIEDAFFL